MIYLPHPGLSRFFPKSLGAILLLTAAACSGDSDKKTITQLGGNWDASGPVTQALACQANVKTGEIACTPREALSRAPTLNGVRLDRRVLGGQGVYVRLKSSGVVYNGGVFSFNVSVQNLLNLSYATLDGAARHTDGVRVFFSQTPIAVDGAGDITIANATGLGTFTGSNQPYFQYGGAIGGTDQSELGGDGILIPGETSNVKPWQFNVPATVNTFSFLVYVTTETAAGAITSSAPQIASISPATMVPGQTATITGVNFHATPGANTITVGGVSTTATSGTTTELQFTVPCALTGTPVVQVSMDGKLGAPFTHPLAVANPISLAVGQAVVVTDPNQVACNELAPTGTESKYVVAVYSASTSPTSNSSFQISADAADVVTPATSLATDIANAPLRTAGLSPSRNELGGFGGKSPDEKHAELLEKNRQAYEQLRVRFANDPRMRPKRRDSGVLLDVVEPPLTRTIKVPNINTGTFCSSNYPITVTRVFYNGKIAIYEDDSTADAFKASLNPTMQDYYNKIGTQFNEDMEPVLAASFGNILRRDAITDNNGVLIAVFTPRINTSFPNVAGFVVTCDQFPNDGDVNASSNFGEVFYAYQPVVNGTGYTGNTPDNWYRTIRSTFIHESKHVISQAARVENNAPSYEVGWLEEGTARHAEELWGRNAIDNMPWKGDNGYGSAADPRGVYCDGRPGFAECSVDPRRPVNIMQRHFSSMYTHMFGTNARLLSPFGATASDNASYYYAVSWSFVRYIIDRYATSEGAFFTALTEATTTGVTNLSARAGGVSIDQLLGGWNLALAVDNRSDISSPSLDVQFQTWNFRSIYTGFNTDFPGTYTLAYPLIPGARSFGSFAPTSIATLRGGGALWYEFGGGIQSNGQLIRLQSGGGGAPPNTLRVAVVRVQ